MSDDLMAFLESAGAGCISGSVSEWPQLKPACKWAAQEIKRYRRIEDGAVMPLDAATHSFIEFIREYARAAYAPDLVNRLAAFDATRRETQ